MEFNPLPVPLRVRGTRGQSSLNLQFPLRAQNLKVNEEKIENPKNALCNKWDGDKKC